MWRKGRRAYFVFLLLILFTVSISGFYMYHIYTFSQQVDSANYLQDNWFCEASSGTYYSLTPPLKVKNHADNTMVLTHVLPDALQKYDSVCFRSTQQSVRVYLDDTQVYEYHDPGSVLTGTATPSHWNFVPLDTTDAHKTLRIELTSPYPAYAGNVNAIHLGSYADINSNILNFVLHGYVCSLLLLAFGFLILFSSFLFSAKNKGLLCFRHLGIFTILLASWMRTEVQLPDYLLFEPHIERLIGISSLFLCPIPYLLFIKQRSPQKHYKVLNFMVFLFSANFLICMVLQLLGVRDLIESSLRFPILVFPTMIIICSQYLLQLKRKPRIYPLFSILAFFSLVSSIIIAYLYYYFGLYKYLGFIFRVNLTFYIACLTFSAADTIITNQVDSAQQSELILKRQIKMMLSHIQPHFLFNSLGAIQSLIKKTPDTAYQMLFDFSKYLRSSINAWNDQPLIPFSSEIENVKSFTNIQLMRFHNCFRIEFELDATDFSVPLLSIRALVENAVNHGARKSAFESPFVLIHSYETEGYYMIEIVDNGPGFDVNKTLYDSDSSFGIQRCQHLFQSQMNATLHIHSTRGKGTTVIVRIPRRSLESREK